MTQLGVLFLPTVVKNGFGFSCTKDKSSCKVFFSFYSVLGSSCNIVIVVVFSDFGMLMQDTSGSMANSRNRKIKLVSLTWPGRDDHDDSNSEVVPLPVPYELPPKLYSSQGQFFFLSFALCPLPFSLFLFRILFIVEGHFSCNFLSRMMACALVASRRPDLC